MRRYTNTIYIFLIISIVLMCLIFVFGTSEDNIDDYLQISFQFLLTAIIGGVISLIYKELSVEKQKWEVQKEKLKELNLELIQSYNDIKENRRLLRSQARKKIDNSDCFLSESYNDLMIELNKIQLNIEKNKRKLETGFDFLKNKNNLITQLDKMDKYLHNIIEEHEFAFRKYKSLPDFINASDLPLVEEYTREKMEAKNIMEGVFVPFRTALKEINSSYEHYISSRII